MFVEITVESVQTADVGWNHGESQEPLEKISEALAQLRTVEPSVDAEDPVMDEEGETQCHKCRS